MRDLLIDTSIQIPNLYSKDSNADKAIKHGGFETLKSTIKKFTIKNLLYYDIFLFFEFIPRYYKCVCVCAKKELLRKTIYML